MDKSNESTILMEEGNEIETKHILVESEIKPESPEIYPEKELITPSGDIEENAEPEKLARVHGRFLYQDGTPAEGVELALHGWQSNDEAVKKYGLPRNWKDLKTKTNSEGEFEFRLDPPQAYQFTLESKFEGYAEVSWRWYEFLPGEDKDLGVTRLARSGTILVTMKNAQGEAIKSGWTIYAKSELSGGTARDRTRVYAEQDPITGIACIENIPPGPTQLEAQSEVAGWFEGPSVDVIAGEQAEAEIIYTGFDDSRFKIIDNSRRIVLWLETTPPAIAHYIDTSAVMISKDGMHWAPAKRYRHTQFSFEDLEPGKYTVKVENECFAPWRKSNIEPGSRSFYATVTGNAALKVTAVNDYNGEPVENHKVMIRYMSYAPNISFDVLSEPAFSASEGVYSGITAKVGCNLVVEAEGYFTFELALGEFVPNEIRSVEARLKRAAMITGRVVQSDGKTPVAEAYVQLQQVGTQLRDGAWHFNDEDKAVTMTDESGRFRLCGFQTGTWDLHAYPHQCLWVVASIDSLTIGDGELMKDIELRLPPASILEGKLVFEPNYSFKDMQLILTPSTWLDNVESPQYYQKINVELAEDGSINSGLLPPGHATLTLQGVSSKFTYSIPKIEVTELTLKPGINNMGEIKLKNQTPGSIKVHVFKNGLPSAGNLAFASKKEARVGASTETVGIAEIKSLFPGEWMIAVRRTQYDGWHYVHPTPITVKPGEQSECTVYIQVYEGKIRILNDEMNEPLASQKVHVFFPDQFEQDYTTDRNGWLHLILSPGTYGLSAASGWDNRLLFKKQITWTSTGPTDSLVRLRTD
ncbi:MAG: carboxypeptidase-like regulatory domain-containing protein [Planctomycetota bacterium]